MRSAIPLVLSCGTALISGSPCVGQPQIIDINARQVCGFPLAWGSGPTLQLSAGRYEVMAVNGPAHGGVFIAWSPWDSNAGCDPGGANCTRGYKTRIDARIDDGPRIALPGVGGAGNLNYATPELALANAAPDYLELSATSDVMFYIHDTPCNDNRGGLTVRVTRLCYANCDGSTSEPVLTVDDFTCFINQFAAAQGLPHEQQVVHYANCDGSTVAPVLTVDDFTCFINEFAAGCL